MILFHKNHRRYCRCISWRRILILLAILCILGITLTITFLFPVVNSYDNNNICISKENHYQLRLRPKPNIFPKLPDKDYNTLINITNFQFDVINKTVCENSYTFILVIISSAPENYKRRQTIRTTWGRNDVQVKTFFMLGAIKDPNLQKEMDHENQLHNDIVQGNFIDSYRNLTYKSVMALKFIVYHCTNAKYILKTDDDVFIRMPLLKNYLTNDMSPFGAENYLHCHILANRSVMRDTRSKWYVSKEEYADDYYPTYCNGAYSLFSPDVAFKLYIAAQNTTFFVWEDVFLYGLAVKSYPEIKRSDTRSLSLSYRDYTRNMLSSGAFDNTNFIIGPFGMDAQAIDEFWKYFLDKPVPSSLYEYVIV